MLWHLNSFYALMLFLSLSPRLIICDPVEKRAIDLNEVADFVDIVENDEIASTDSVQNSLKKVNDIEIDLPDGLKTILPVHVRNVSTHFTPNQRPAKNHRRQIYTSNLPSPHSYNINNDYRGDHLQHLISFKMRQYKPRTQIRKKRSLRRKRSANYSPILLGGESKSYLGNLALATNDAFLRMQNYAATLMVLVTTPKPGQKKETKLTWPRYTPNGKSSNKKPTTGKQINILFKRKPSYEHRRESYTKSLTPHKNEKNKYRKASNGSSKKPTSTKQTTPETKKDSEEKSNDSKRQGNEAESLSKSVSERPKLEADKNIKQYVTPPGNMKDLLRVISPKKATTAEKHENGETSVSSTATSTNSEAHQTSITSQSTVTHLSSEETHKTATEAANSLTISTGFVSTVSYAPKKNPYAWENEILKGSKIKIKKDVPTEIYNLPEEAELADQGCSKPITKHVDKSNQLKNPASEQPTLETVETENMISSGFHKNGSEETPVDQQRKISATVIPPAAATAGYQLDYQQNRIENKLKIPDVTPGIRQAEESHSKTESAAETPAPAPTSPAPSSPAPNSPATNAPAAEASPPAGEKSPSVAEKGPAPEPSPASPLAAPTMAETTAGPAQATEHTTSASGNAGTTCADAICAKVIQNNAIFNVGPDCDSSKEDGKDDESGGIDIPSKEEVDEMERINQKARATTGCEHTTTDSCKTTTEACTTTPAPCNSKQNQDSCDNNDDDDNETVCDEGSGQAPNVRPQCSEEDEKQKVQKVKPKFRLRRQISLLSSSPSSTTPHYTLVKLPNMNLPMLAQQTQLPQISPVHVNQVRAIDAQTSNLVPMGSSISVSTVQVPSVTAVKKSVDRNIIESVVENLKIVDQKLAEAVDPLHSAQEALDNASKCESTTTACGGDNVLADISDSERNALQKLAYKIINSPKVKRSDVKPNKNGNIVKRGLVGETKKKNEKLEPIEADGHSDYYDIGELNQEISRLERDLTIADELQDILDDIKKDSAQNNGVARSKRTAAYLNPGIVEEREDNLEEGQKPSKTSHKHVKSKHKHIDIKEHSLAKKEQLEDEEEIFGRKKKKKKKIGGRKNIWMRLFGKRHEGKGFLDKNLQNSQFAEK